MIYFNVFLLFTPCFLIAQDEIIIDLRNKSMNIIIASNYNYIKVDSNYNPYNHSDWGGQNKKDTFFYFRKKIIRDKTITGVVPIIYNASYQLHRKLNNKSWLEKDSILNATMQKNYGWQPSRSHHRISYKMSSISYYKKKYPYIDIYETNQEKGDNRNWYISEATRIFIIGEVEYYIYIRNYGKTSKSILRSRKAVCCDFKRLVNNIRIIDPEDLLGD